MRKIVSFVPAVLSTGVFGYLSIMLREFNLILFLTALAFIASGVFSCLDCHILSLICGFAPAAYFAYEGFVWIGGFNSMFFWISGAIVMFYVCYYVSVAVYHRELNRK